MTDVGRVRHHNEDALGVPANYERQVAARGWLFAVADGMGGHADGEVASSIAVQTLFETYYSSNGSAADGLVGAMEAANLAVYTAGRNVTPDDPTRRMGTTLIASVFNEQHLFGLSVGDSRAYLFRKGELIPLTHDQTLAAEQARIGLMTEEDAKRSRFRSVLLQCLGHSPSVKPEHFHVEVSTGDLVLLCSDGLHGAVSDDNIRRLLMSGSIENSAKALIDAANRNGGHDNISVVLVNCA